MVFRQHVAQRLVDALRKRYGDPGADSLDLDMFDGVQLGKYLIQLCRGEYEGIPAGEKHVPDFPVLPQVVEDIPHHGIRGVPVHFTDLSPAQTVAAEPRTDVRYVDRYPVRVPSHQILHGGAVLLSGEVGNARQCHLTNVRKHLPSNGTPFIFRIHQAGEVRSERPPES